MFRTWLASTALALAVAAGTVVAGETARVMLEVPSMNCSLCPIAVSTVLRKQPGVRKATADLATKSAQVDYDPAMTSPARLARAVSDAGYPATPRSR
jgi:mercuric ion binding protein